MVTGLRADDAAFRPQLDLPYGSTDSGSMMGGMDQEAAAKFDYGAPAELFTTKRSRGPRGGLGYRRFDTAAEAIRYFIEELPSARMPGAFMQVGEERFDGDEIRALYDGVNSR